MAGRGPAPKEHRQRKRDEKRRGRGSWDASQAVHWAHGTPPEAPAGLMPASIEAWTTWFSAWFAAHWTPDDLPGLRQLIRLYDQVERGEFQRAGELRLQMDTYGITPKGQQDRRWKRPDTTEEVSASQRQSGSAPSADHYAHLRVVND